MERGVAVVGLRCLHWILRSLCSCQHSINSSSSGRRGWRGGALGWRSLRMLLPPLLSPILMLQQQLGFVRMLLPPVLSPHPHASTATGAFAHAAATRALQEPNPPKTNGTFECLHIKKSCLGPRTQWLCVVSVCKVVTMRAAFMVPTPVPYLPCFCCCGPHTPDPTTPYGVLAGLSDSHLVTTPLITRMMPSCVCCRCCLGLIA